MQLNYVFDQATSSLPAGFVAALDSVAAYFDKLVTAQITVTIEVGYGEITQNGQSSQISSDALAEGGDDNGDFFTYGQIKTALADSGSSAAVTSAIASLPSSDPTNGTGIYLTTAQEKAMGLSPANGAQIDGSIGFATQSSGAEWDFNLSNQTAPNEYDFFGTAEHEITHALGRETAEGEQGGANDYSQPLLFDLFRFTGAGQLGLAKSAAAGTTEYFSIDGGKTNLDTFDTTSDAGDWAGMQGTDSFDAYGLPGVASPLTATDLDVLDVLGFNTRPSNLVAPSDFGGGGTSDILLQNSAGVLVDWIVSDGAIAGGDNLGTNPGWNPVGTGDFNGNGVSDILMQNSAGTVVDWTMQNGTVSKAAVIGNSVGFNVVGTGDFTGNGTDDILLQNSAGTIVDWIVNNGAITAGDNLGTNPGWNVVGTGDFNGDGTTDVLLENSSTKTVVDWTMGNGTVASAAVIGNAGAYNIVGTGDFIGNGTSDTLLQNAAGDIVDWIMSNGAIATAHDLGVNPGWSVAATGDYTGNGVNDILLTNSAGAVVDWTMGNGVVTNGVLIGNSVGFTVKH